MNPQPHSTTSAAQEWRAHWPLVLSALAGISFAAVPSATLGLFMEPLNREFGWSRTEISAGLTIFAMVSLLLTPFAGVLVDKYGPRRVAIPGMALSGTVFACFGLLVGSMVQWLLTWVAFALASRLITTLVWNSAVSGAFSAGRGLAIAVLLSGLSLASALAPTLTHWLIEALGWRGAYISLGLGWGGIALVLLLFFFFSHLGTAKTGARDEQRAVDHPPAGLSVKQAVGNFTLQRIGFATFLQTTMGAAIAVHLVPLLSQSGIGRAEAAGMAAILGIAAVAGKLVSGWLVDRLTSSLLPFATFSAPALAHFLLLQGLDSHIWIPIAVGVLGYSSGASLHLTTYLVTRYAGLRSFGTIFGLISSLMALSAGVGPLLAGAIFDSTGSYTILLTVGICVALIAGGSVLRLGPFPDFRAVDSAPNGPSQPAPPVGGTMQET